MTTVDSTSYQLCVQIFVFFPEDAKVGVKSIKAVCEKMKSEGVKRAIMVNMSNLTPFAKQCLEEVRQVHYIETVRCRGFECVCTPCVHSFKRWSCWSTSPSTSLCPGTRS